MAKQTEEVWWTEQRLRLLYELFQGQRTITSVCRDLDISAATARRWMAEPWFKTRLAQMRDQLIDELEGVPFVRKEQRILALSRHAEDALHEWETKRYLIEQRPVPQGMLTNEKLNRDASDIFRASLADIAAELGSRKQALELSSPDGSPAIVINQVALTTEALARYLRPGGETADELVEATVDYEAEDAAQSPFAQLDSGIDDDDDD